MRIKRLKIVFLTVLMLITVLNINVYASEKKSETGDSTKKEISEYTSEQYPLQKKKQQESLEQTKNSEKQDCFSKNSIDKTEEDIVNVAYNNMIKKEKYIVDLISQHSGKQTSLDAWEYNLQYLLTHYNEIKNVDNINMLYVESYIEDYKIVMATQNMPLTKRNERSTYATSYNYSNAVRYAEAYYQNYNSAYPDWTSYGGDCANFISQCLYAGGKAMKGTPGTASAAQNLSNWFSSGKTCNTNNVSSTWRGANAFKSYWQRNASGYSKFSTVSSNSYNYGFCGDAVSLLNSNGSAYHTLIIVGYDSANKDFIVAAHTGNTKTAKLSSYSPAGGFIIYNMR